MNRATSSRLARDEGDARARDQARPGRGLRPPRARRRGACRPRVFISTYHDTTDLRLARNGVTFRHRVEDGAGLWQLKLPRDAARLELELPGPPARPPAELVGLLPAYLRGRRARAGRAPAHAAGGGASPTAPRSSTTASPSSRASTSPAGSGRSRSSSSTATSARCAGSRSSCARRARASSGELRPKLYRALDLAGPLETPANSEGHAAGRGARQRSPGRLPGAARPRPGDAPRRRSRGSPPASRRDAAAAGLPARRATARRPGLGRVAPRGARLARRAPRARRATSTSCSAVSATEVEALGARRVRARQGCSRHSRTSARPPIATWPRRSRATGTSRCSTGSKQPARRRRAERRPRSRRSSSSETKRMRRKFDDLGEDPEDDALHAARIGVKRARYAADLAAHELGQAGDAVRLDREEAAGHPRRPPGRRRRRRRGSGTGPPRTTRPRRAFAAGRLVQLERERMAAARRDWPDLWRKLDTAARKAAKAAS